MVFSYASLFYEFSLEHLHTKETTVFRSELIHFPLAISISIVFVWFHNFTWFPAIKIWISQQKLWGLFIFS